MRLENRWYKTRTQVNFLRSVAENLDEEFLIIHAKTLHILEAKLNQATLTVADLLKRPKPHSFAALFGQSVADHLSPAQKARYAFRKKSLDTIVVSIKDWQAEFDPTWYYCLSLEKKSLVGGTENQSVTVTSISSDDIIAIAATFQKALRMGPASVLTQNQTIFADESAIIPEQDPVLFSSLLTTRSAVDEAPLLLDRMISNPAADINATTEDVRDMAIKLSTVDPEVFGLLRCLGVIKSTKVLASLLFQDRPFPEAQPFPEGKLAAEGEPTTEGDSDSRKIQPPEVESTYQIFDFLFIIPKDLHSPRSLRSILVGEVECSLNDRFKLAKRLVNAVSFVHTSRFVHKNIRPETIVLFRDDKSPIGEAFLAGFTAFRLASGMTYFAGDSLWERNICETPCKTGPLSTSILLKLHRSPS